MIEDRHEENGVDRQRADEFFSSVLATTRALDQMTSAEDAMLDAALSKPAEEDWTNVPAHARRLAPALTKALASSDLPAPSAELRAAVEREMDAASVSPAQAAKPAGRVRSWRFTWVEGVVLVALIGIVVGLCLPA